MTLTVILSPYFCDSNFHLSMCVCGACACMCFVCVCEWVCVCIFLHCLEIIEILLHNDHVILLFECLMGLSVSVSFCVPGVCVCVCLHLSVQLFVLNSWWYFLWKLTIVCCQRLIFSLITRMGPSHIVSREASLTSLSSLAHPQRMWCVSTSVS